MKKLLVALIVLASIVACGKNNKVNSNTSGVSNPITTSVQGAGELGKLIENYSNNFGSSPITYYGNYMTLGQLANQGLNMGYHFTKSTTTSSNNNCTLKWGIFYVCSYSSSSSSTGVTESKKVSNNNVNILDKQNELKGYINNSISINQQGSSYMVVGKDGKRYVIDTRYPLQANPIGISDSSGTEYLFNITEN